MEKIMFSDKLGLTQAVLEGRKTQTRRIVPERVLDNLKQFQEEYYDATFDKLEDVELLTDYFLTERLGKLPYNIGEVVAVAQSYNDCGYKCFHYRDTDEFMYIVKDNKEISICPAGVRNKMFVAPSLMPHQIQITDVRVERLQDISDEDCLKEGIRKVVNENNIDVQYYVGHDACFETPREAFAHLIDKVSGKGTWNSNPYVWVYDFGLMK